MSKTMIPFIDKMKHSPAHNYVIPGLTSWLIGLPHPTMGCVRLFTMSRYHEEPILPHSHRFDFRCMVLRGSVCNQIWMPAGIRGDIYAVSDVTYEGKLGVHQRTEVDRGFFTFESNEYLEGEEYSMKAEQFHSIFFEKDSMVLFFEGPNRLTKSQILEPVVDGERIPLFRTDDWMFKREKDDKQNVTNS